jgi:hypothetical protein
VSENRVLRRIFGPKREEVAEGWRRLHNEELRNLYASPNIVRVIKPRRMRLAGHVERMGGMRSTQIFWSENLKGRHHSKELGVDGRIILEWTLGN